jgi:hypothetical protein
VHRIQFPGRCIRYAATPLALLLLTAASARAQRATIGGGVGFNFENKDALIAAQASIPLVNRLEFYPSIDVYFPDHGSLTGFNADLKLLFPEPSGPDFYVGGGLGLLHRSVDDHDNTDVGANFFFGLESRLGFVHPFIEGRAILNDNSSFQITGGLNFAVGGS